MLNWYQAMNYCRSRGMYLIDIPTNDEEQRVLKIINDKNFTQSYWTSGTDLGSEGKFYWMTTGAEVFYNNFRANEPNNREYHSHFEEHCIEMRKPYNYLWNDLGCSRELHVICREYTASPILNEVKTEN